LKQVLVPVRWYRRSLSSRGTRIVAIDILVNDVYIAVRCDRCYREHEWFFRGHSIFEEAMSFRRDDICGVLALVGDGRVMISLECCVAVFICEWVEKEIRSRETSSMGLVVIGDFLGVEKLADVVCVITSRLQPQRKVILVEALRNEFRIAAWLQ